MHRFSMRTWPAGLIAVALIFQTLGCSSSSSGLIPVTGKVIVDGKPATGASVVFFPEPPGEASKIAAGVVDDTGQFSLVTNLEPGINPGKYKVAVTWPTPPKDGVASFSMGNAKDPPDLLKSRYADPKKTTLSADITATTKELPPFELSIK